ncbi:hypothetical protein PVAR5_8336 [Paecilomyces variotii No. 5]|uniref:Integral membrane protein n=1 Tax=Byssochlamys spectabilis (strain No. 5 / NBRC 109023) TaxID=1356009 RepID=V5I5U2_BYSSN|nr:hypothetical protein PVAR5_8336 [Paecilomyces variotii No. 5]
MASNRVPLDYVVPPFPSLYDPVFARAGEANYLYYTTDIWRFTLFWTLLLTGGAHLMAAGCAIFMQWRNWRVIWITPLVYGVIGGLEALLAGSIVGLLKLFDVDLDTLGLGWNKRSGTDTIKLPSSGWSMTWDTRATGANETLHELQTFLANILSVRFYNDTVWL